MTARHARRFVIGQVEEGVVHSKRVKNARLEKLLKRLSAQAFHQRPQHISRHAVVVSGAGLKTQGKGRQLLDKGIEIRALAQAGVAVGALHGVLNVPAVSEARGMGH